MKRDPDYECVLKPVPQTVLETVTHQLRVTRIGVFSDGQTRPWMTFHTFQTEAEYQATLRRDIRDDLLALD